MLENENISSGSDDEDVRKEAKHKGKASFHTWLMATAQGQDPAEYERKSQERARQKWLAYSDYVRYEEEVPADKSEISYAEGTTVSQVNFTLEDLKRLIDQRFTQEREHTRALMREEVGQVREEVDKVREEVGQMREEVGQVREEVGQIREEVGQVREEVGHVRGELIAQFSSFIENNFDPTMSKFDRRFDNIEDHQDQTDINIASLKTDVRHIRQALQIPGELAKSALRTS
jgi:septation ring formation regulator EzrA